MLHLPIGKLILLPPRKIPYILYCQGLSRAIEKDCADLVAAPCRGKVVLCRAFSPDLIVHGSGSFLINYVTKKYIYVYICIRVFKCYVHIYTLMQCFLVCELSGLTLNQLLSSLKCLTELFVTKEFVLLRICLLREFGITSPASQPLTNCTAG